MVDNRNKRYPDNNLLFLEEDKKKKPSFDNTVLKDDRNRVKQQGDYSRSNYSTYKNFLDSDKAVEDYVQDAEKAKHKQEYRELFRKRPPLFSKNGVKNLIGDAKSGSIWFVMFFVSLFALYAVFVVYNTGNQSFVEITGSDYKTPYDGNLARGDFKFLDKKVNSDQKDKLFELFNIKNKREYSSEGKEKIASSLNNLKITNSSENLLEGVEVKSSDIAMSSQGTGRNEAYSSQVAREGYEKEVKNIKDLLHANQNPGSAMGLDTKAPQQTLVANVESEEFAPVIKKQPNRTTVTEKPEVKKEEVKKASMFDKKVWQVQVYSAQSVADARKKWTDLQKVNPQLFLDQRLHILEANVDGKMYYRLRIGFVNSNDNNKGYFETKSQAVNFCNVLRDEGIDCYPTLTEFKVLK